MNKYASQSKAAQKQRRREKMCELKRAYPSAEAAYQAGQTSYRCRHCGQWHRSGQTASLAGLAANINDRRRNGDKHRRDGVKRTRAPR